jgi:cytochrome c oxidase cbb3-type subunit 2
MRAHMKGLRAVGVPYSEGDLEPDYLRSQLEGRTEEDALVAYLQVLGTMVKLDDSKAYRE